MTAPGEVKPSQPGDDHRRIDDSLQQPAFHDFEGFGLLRADLGIAVIDKQPRQIEHSGHPCDDRDHMQCLDRGIGRDRDPLVHRATPCLFVERSRPARHCLRSFAGMGRRHILNAPLLLTNIYRILGLSLSSGELDSQQIVPQFSRLIHIDHHFYEANRSFE